MKKLRNHHFILDTTEKPQAKVKIKRFLDSVKAVGYKMRLKSIKVKSTEKKYKVAVCAIFKNEAPYLKEWIEFNHIVGIEHFYLYNNNSEDDYISVLQPYIDCGLVTLTQWPMSQGQMQSYIDCINRFSNETQWIGLIDLDEFIVPIETNNVYEFLKPFENRCGAVKIYWKMFGTAGLLDRSLNSLVTETFTVSWPLYYSVGKCFYNTNFDINFDDKQNLIFNHLCWTSYKGKKLPPVNAFNKICMNNRDKVRQGTHPIQINHYFSKSYMEYCGKISRGDAFFKINPRDDQYFYLHEMENTSTDYSAYKYLIKLKLAMEEKK